MNNLEIKKSLNILKYNKNIKERINISSNDYKQYAEKYSSIEIEIKLNEKGKLINIPEEDKKYYHVFLDNKEIQKFNGYFSGDINKKIKIKIDYQVKSLKKLFCECESIESIDFKKFYRNNINDMSEMFKGCLSLKELNFDNFNTDNVVDMSEMFEYCSSLDELNLNKFNTNNVKNMNCMFRGCDFLREIHLDVFNTNKVTDMNNMFCDCSTLTKINLSNFNRNNVTHMNDMFCG